VALMFLLAYGASQIICDSTRYDSLFLRSNGFISVVQILGLVALLVPLVVFAVRMVKRNGLKIYQFAIWLVIAGMMGLAGYMEYYVQRHGNEAAFAYSTMGASLVVIVILSLVMRGLGNRAKKEAVAEPETEE
jgi:nitrate reductase gamma subunit